MFCREIQFLIEQFEQIHLERTVDFDNLLLQIDKPHRKLEWPVIVEKAPY